MQRLRLDKQCQVWIGMQVHIEKPYRLMFWKPDVNESEDPVAGALTRRALQLAAL
jgi:hypothetical protein